MESRHCQRPIVGSSKTLAWCVFLHLIDGKNHCASLLKRGRIFLASVTLFGLADDTICVPGSSAQRLSLSLRTIIVLDGPAAVL
jgi:hypothetical protein